MGKLFRDGEKPSQRVLEIIVGYMNRVARPVYLGFVSLEIGWSLARTKEMLDFLEEKGIVRAVPHAELRSKGFREDAVVYELTKLELSKARF